MPGMYSGHTEERLARRLTLSAVAMVFVAFAAVVAAALLPIEVPTSAPETGDRGIESAAGPERDLEELLHQAAGSDLIKPAQIQAAVKDTGAARQLAKALTLQGVVQVDETLTAYIEVKDEGVKTVREGDKILDFVVKELKPGKVVLSLDGVEVQLGR